MKKSLTQKLKEAKELIKGLNEENDTLRCERNSHRQFIINEFKHQIECKNTEQWPPKSVIQRIAKHMAMSPRWYW